MIYLIITSIIIAIVAYYGLKPKKQSKSKGSNVGHKEPIVNGKEHLNDFKQNEINN